MIIIVSITVIILISVIIIVIFPLMMINNSGTIFHSNMILSILY